MFGYVDAMAGRRGIDASTAATDTDSQSGIDILLGLASRSIAEQRLVAPQGSNAYEFYLSVLQLEPNNPTAQDKLRQLLPTATAEVERTINQDELSEAQRELSLLREFDSTNYTLSLLGGKLDAHRQLLTRRHEAQAALIQAARAGTQ